MVPSWYGSYGGLHSWCRESDVDVLRRNGYYCRGKDLQQSGEWNLEKDGRKRDGEEYTMGRDRKLGCGGAKLHGMDCCLRKLDEREPGELSSGGSSDIEGGFKKSADADEASSCKKRKFSPVVWDLDEKKGCVIDLKIVNNDPVHGASDKNSSAKRAKASEEELATADMDAGVVLFQNKWVENGEESEPLGAVDVPERAISFSRWAKDVIEDDEVEAYDVEFTSNRRNNTHLRSSLDESLEPGEVVSLEDSDASPSLAFGSGGLYHGSSLETSDGIADRACALGEDSNSNGSVDSFEIHEGCRVEMGSAEQPHAQVNMLQGCRSVDEFEKLNKINEGTYGIVYRARDMKTGEIVALKKVKMANEKEGFPLTSLREINVLLSLHHPSIVQVKEVVMGRNLDDIFMVMEYMDFDLKGLLGTMKKPFHLSEIKCLMLQLLAGVKHLHDNWVLHRDLKTSNLLFNNHGELKICDFGLSRQYGSPLKPCTQLVVTLWYRAPELLLGATKYSTGIDMWSLGCIMAELLSKEPLFPGKNEVDQLDKIFGIMGTPDEKSWPRFSRLPGAKVKFAKKPFKLHEKFHRMSTKSFLGYPLLSDAGFDLLSKLLTYDPDKRITAEDALNHPWFHESPLPISKEFMPTFPSQLEQLRQKDTLRLGNLQIGLLLLHNGVICCGIICLIINTSDT